MLYPIRITCALVLLIVAHSRATADDAFQRQVMPFLSTYCVHCHNQETSKGEMDLTRYTSAAALSEHFRQWEHVLTFLKKEEMPPEGEKQPSSAERAEVLTTLRELMVAEAQKLSGDPGVVLPRRLTGAEYNYTIRDLTGVDIRPAESFPIDPAAGEGFNNTGEALVMSPNLFKKYYAAAQYVADHVVLTPTEMSFAPYPVVTFADQMKLHEQAILRFYEQHNVVYETYLTAAWQFRHRPAARNRTTMEAWAVEHQVSPKYLRAVWETLHGEPADDPFYLGWLRRQWHALPGPADVENPVATSEVKQAIGELAGNIRRASALLCVKGTEAIISHAGNGPVQHIDNRKKTAASRDAFDETFMAASRRIHADLRQLQAQPVVTIRLQAEGVPAKKAEVHEAKAYVVLRELNFSTKPPHDYKPEDKANNLSLRELLEKHAPDEWQRLKPGVHPLGTAVDPHSVVLTTGDTLEVNLPKEAFGNYQDLLLYADATLDRGPNEPGAVRVTMTNRPLSGNEFFSLLVDPQSPLAATLAESSSALCRTFPNRFVYVDDTRGLSAGFHLIEGVFRDDMPLRRLVLSDDQNQELDRLWEELYFGTGMMEKMLRGFVFFERSERNFLKHPDFDPFKEEDPELTKDETLARFEQVYLTRSDVKPDDPKLAENPIHLFFAEIRDGLKQRKAKTAAAKPVYLRQLLEFAERAYRRPLTEQEIARLGQFYEATSQQPEFGVEGAVRGVVTSILVSPHFCFRVDVPPAGDAVMPLADIALASRLSYFLWSSTPDAELLALAKAGKLSDEATLRQQTRRMLHDPKVGGFALEFFGQWLKYRDFLSQEAVDRRVFPAFNDELKQAMFEEPTRLVTHLIQSNLPITDVLYGDATFVNKPLAEHYGWPFSAAAGEWQKVDGIQQHGRGGVLGMAVFLTTYSQPQRTSPVKRGFWVVHKILGEHIPAPPNDVPVLPAKETETDGKTIRQLLAQHTEAETCARCHRRFDPVGLAMEGFDPIGKRRTQDLAGRSIDNAVKLSSGGEARGVPEFLKYLRAERNDEFIDTLCHKFLGFALGRSVELSDHALLEQVKSNLRRDDYRFATLFETVVCSPQFRNQRCRDFSIARFASETQGD